ncbi:hypothetical protein GWK47_045756 [Chionoecetes opilio]|uniref:Uncharacterized protein n=1 Tax=Chionoecetes opilio TaxID=41210 RepID=A0A8J4YEI6_CHIOP|nr:hypothetical protein GWK47_045756 [Chionoecetes opilio]
MIYSVRVRDKGPDYRGFVQIPLIQSVDGSGDIFIGTEPLGDPMLLLQMGARCYVEPCLRKSQQPSLCSHIRAASNCYKDAMSLTLKNSALNSLPIPQAIKTDIWQLATDTPGPLVQRVSKNIMVVKCKPEALYPLGFLHFSFQQVRSKEEIEFKYYCGCRAFKIQPAARDVSFRKCVHLYACVVAFASDNNLSQEFSYYINMIQNDQGPPSNLRVSGSNGEESSVTLGENETSLSTVGERSFLILNDSGDSSCQVEVEVLQEDSSSILEGIPISQTDNLVTQEDIEGKLEIQLRTPEGIHLRTSDGGTISVHQIPDTLPVTGIKRRRDDSVVQASSALLTLQEGNLKKASLLNRDGSYRLFRQRDEDPIYAKGSANQPLLKPQEYKTRLRVGTPFPGQKEPTPFIIEWIPDILPLSCIGELRIKFEFDHLHNGQLLTPRESRGAIGGQTLASARSQVPLLAPRPQSQATSQSSSQISAGEHIISIPITSETAENMATILTF